VVKTGGDDPFHWGGFKPATRRLFHAAPKPRLLTC